MRNFDKSHYVHLGDEAPEDVTLELTKQYAVILPDAESEKRSTRMKSPLASAPRPTPSIDVDLWLMDTGSGVDVINRDEAGELGNL